MKEVLNSKLISVMRYAALFVLPLLAPLVMTYSVNAQSPVQAGACSGSGTAGGALTFTATPATTTCTNSEPKIQLILTDIVNIFSVVVGIIAVIMIIVGGFRYITGGGSGDVSGAKNTIIYALIGLVIVALAQVLVHFVLFRATTAAAGG
jgi:hypothetical protein